MFFFFWKRLELGNPPYLYLLCFLLFPPEPTPGVPDPLLPGGELLSVVNVMGEDSSRLTLVGVGVILGPAKKHPVHKFK